ncbi:hypothetical protein H2200_010622 [Cladophialophora chaetospira]|uniref:SnoaL-like domain-containing protein n=1 Tax=Cladophialophora chaetospira TaxID=386627 RepID=A0AA38X1U4_9EURO|nr:hypothetical protein H2200_010622 [Cladophialophora chaetospira]
MATHTTVQELIKTRLTHIKEASERRDVDAVVSWYSKDATFVDPGTTRFPFHGIPVDFYLFVRLKVRNISIVGSEALRRFYANAYDAIPTCKISNPEMTGLTPEFVACEMNCEGEVAKDVPPMGLKAGDTLKTTGVSLFWWRWEGKSKEWDGDLSEEGVRGWKITQERAYHLMTGKADEHE